MRFSEHFGVEKRKESRWFDPFLTIDTKLFIDPFLIYADEFGPFEGSHDEVISFFNSVFGLVARSGGRSRNIWWKRACDRLLFPEVEEICLGYVSAGTKGSGSGKGLARIIAQALWEAVLAGIEEFSHFEEIGIIREGIGADRISDITANLIRYRLANYTSQICAENGIEVSYVRYLRGRYDRSNDHWMPHYASLPRNPYSGKPVLLVPERFLRALPTISPEGFWEYCFVNENEVLRREYGQDISRNVDKHRIIDLARRHPALRRRYISTKEASAPQPYDFSADPEGLVLWDAASREFCSQNPLQFRIRSREDLVHAISSMIEGFSGFVRENRGWKLLWNDDGKNKNEEASQLLFLGIARHYCRANDIDISREADIGRGPVDFKVSSGYRLRALIEVKLGKNTKFWQGLRHQLPAYLAAEKIDLGYFLVVLLRDRDLERLKYIREKVREVAHETGYSIRHAVVDARYGGPPSASHA